MSDPRTNPRPPSHYGVTHPLDLLTAAEIEAAREFLVQAGKVTDTTRFPRVMPLETPSETLYPTPPL